MIIPLRTDIKQAFPGYYCEWEKLPNGKSVLHNWYRREDPGRGGYVYAEPGMYYNVAVLDVVSMHPTSMILMNYLGEYTPKFKELVDARIHIKKGEYDKAKKLFNGKLEPYLSSKENADQLAYALKIAINAVYGQTAATYESPFRHKLNNNNVVCLRGALFMIDLKNAVQEKGFKVVHIKTDSIKVPDASEDIVSFIQEFSKEYGYEMEYEGKYEKMCLVNDAVLIAKKEKRDKKGKLWTAVGKEFQVPFVFKTLFSKEEIEFQDLCETKSANTAMYLNFNENTGENNYVFVGKVGSFAPVREGTNGGLLVRTQALKEGENSELDIISPGFKAVAVAGTTGFRWKERNVIRVNQLEDQINYEYWYQQAENARKTISKFGNVEEFLK